MDPPATRNGPLSLEEARQNAVALYAATWVVDLKSTAALSVTLIPLAAAVCGILSALSLLSSPIVASLAVLAVGVRGRPI